jgi:hypothetical protein
MPMSRKLLKIIDSFGLWVLASVMVFIVFIQSVLLVRLHGVDTPANPEALYLPGPAGS